MSCVLTVAQCVTSSTPDTPCLTRVTQQNGRRSDAAPRRFRTPHVHRRARLRCCCAYGPFERVPPRDGDGPGTGPSWLRIVRETPRRTQAGNGAACPSAPQEDRRWPSGAHAMTFLPLCMVPIVSTHVPMEFLWLHNRRISHSPPKETAGSSSIAVVIKAKNSCPVILLLARWIQLL